MIRPAFVLLLGGSAVGCGSARPAEEPVQPTVASITLTPVETAVEGAFLRGLVAAREGDFAAARREIGWVASVCSNTGVGGKALLSLLALELDPRNPSRDPGSVRSLIQRYASSRKPVWSGPAIEALYLLAVELGGTGGGDPEAGTDGVTDPAAEMGSGAARPTEAFWRPWWGEAFASSGGDDGTAGGRQTEAGGALELGRGPYQCEARGVDIFLAGTELPDLPGRPLRDELDEVVREREELRQTVASLEEQIAELRQELERIRATLRP